METVDQSSSFTLPPPSEDPEGQGLRILAKLLARRLAKSRRDKNAMPYEQSEDDPPAVTGGMGSDTAQQERSIGPSSISEVKQSG